eukprot:g29913.t1
MHAAGSLEKASGSAPRAHSASAKQPAARIADKGACRRWLYEQLVQTARCAVTAERRDTNLALLWLRARVAGARLSRDGDSLTLWIDQAGPATERALQFVRALGLGADSRAPPAAGALSRLQCARRDSAPECGQLIYDRVSPAGRCPGQPVEGWGEGAFTWEHLLQAEAGCPSATVTINWPGHCRSGRRSACGGPRSGNCKRLTASGQSYSRNHCQTGEQRTIKCRTLKSRLCTFPRLSLVESQVTFEDLSTSVAPMSQ